LTPVDIKSNLEAVQRRIFQACKRAQRSPQEITLVAVTKTVGPEIIEAAFNQGIRQFGENRVQEAARKIQLLSYLQPRPVWHMIGHLQSNKVKTALAVFDVIQTIDSIELADAVNKRTSQNIPVLLQVNIAAEPSKTGFRLSEIESAFQEISKFSRIEIQGLMTVAPPVDNPEEVRPIFRRLREIRDRFHLKHLSMGMSDDFEVALEEGATVIRLGRVIFGERKSL
jgi:pyridoxal phosphate enzyme (YggS family)